MTVSGDRTHVTGTVTRHFKVTVTLGLTDMIGRHELALIRAAWSTCFGATIGRGGKVSEHPSHPHLHALSLTPLQSLPHTPALCTGCQFASGCAAGIITGTHSRVRRSTVTLFPFLDDAVPTCSLLTWRRRIGASSTRQWSGGPATSSTHSVNTLLSFAQPPPYS